MQRFLLPPLPIGSEEEMKGAGLNLCLVSDVGDVIMRVQGEQVLPHYCNENDIPPLHQLEKVAIKVANKIPPGGEDGEENDSLKPICSG